VIFDFFGTIACHENGATSEYPAVFARHGRRLDPLIESAHFARYNGALHLEHSTDRATYEAWVRFRHAELAVACDVPAADVERLVDDLRVSDTLPVVAYPDAAPTLGTLRDRGFRIGVCSNWGWEIDAFLIQADLFDLVDVAITSARAGARKPHQRIFAAMTDALGVRPAEALFVGDSLRPDVEGPAEVGMSAVHLRRPEDSAGAPPGPLPPGAERITSLTALLDWPALERAAGGLAPSS
jgi:putative hydrolase of the HAD superfamily